MALLTIGELAKVSNVPARSIRFYEAKGLLPRPSRTEAGYRTYGPTDVARLAFIRRCRSLDFTLAEVRSLLSGAERECGAFAEQMSASMAEKLDEVDRALQRLAEVRDDLKRSITTLSDKCVGDCQQAAIECCPDLSCLPVGQTTAGQA